MGSPMADHSGKAAADPIPKLEHVVFVDAESAHRLHVGRNGDKVACHRTFVASANEPCRAVIALSIVSWVVNDLDAIRNRVVSGRQVPSVLVMLVGSTLETK